MTKEVSVTVYVWCSHCRKPIKYVLPPVFTKCGSSCLSFILSVTLLLQYRIFFPYCWFGTNYIILQVDTSRTIGTMKLTTCSGSWTWQLDDSFLAWTGYITRGFIMLLFFFHETSRNRHQLMPAQGFIGRNNMISYIPFALPCKTKLDLSDSVYQTI